MITIIRITSSSYVPHPVRFEIPTDFPVLSIALFKPTGFHDTLREKPSDTAY